MGHTRLKNKFPKQYMCIDGQMHIVDRGQFVLVQDYQNLLHRYKKLLKLSHINGLFNDTRTRRRRKKQSAQERRNETGEFCIPMRDIRTSAHR